MGSKLRRARKHSGIRTHPDALDCGKGSWCFHYDKGRREGCTRYTVGAEGGAQGDGTHGYSTEATGNRDGGRKCSTGARVSVDELCEWRDHQGHWWSWYVNVLAVIELESSFVQHPLARRVPCM
jgi:hypothetical protein